MYCTQTVCSFYPVTASNDAKYVACSYSVVSTGITYVEAGGGAFGVTLLNAVLLAAYLAVWSFKKPLRWQVYPSNKTEYMSPSVY